MGILEQCEANMRAGAGPYSSVYMGSGHPYVSDHDLAEWLRPHGTEEDRQHAIALGDVQRARDTLRYYQAKCQSWKLTLTLQRAEDGLLRLALVDYVRQVDFFEPSYVTTPADYRR